MSANQAKTVAELFPSDVQLKNQVADIFKDVDPGLASKTADVRSLFTAERATELLTRLEAIESQLSVNDDYDTTIAKLQQRIDEAEQTRDDVLAELFQQIRPIEQSYRQIQLFFENAKGDPSKAQNPI